MGFDWLQNEAKVNLTKATQRIGRLVAVDEAQRNTARYDNQMLESLQKLLVKNSLIGVKLKMAGDRPVTLFVDWPNCLMESMIALDLKI